MSSTFRETRRSVESTGIRAVTDLIVTHKSILRTANKLRWNSSTSWPPESPPSAFSAFFAAHYRFQLSMLNLPALGSSLAIRNPKNPLRLCGEFPFPQRVLQRRQRTQGKSWLKSKKEAAPSRFKIFIAPRKFLPKTNRQR
jgi:hypothetical protein